MFNFMASSHHHLPLPPSSLSSTIDNEALTLFQAVANIVKSEAIKKKVEQGVIWLEETWENIFCRLKTPRTRCWREREKCRRFYRFSSMTCARSQFLSTSQRGMEKLNTKNICSINRQNFHYSITISRQKFEKFEFIALEMRTRDEKMRYNEYNKTFLLCFCQAYLKMAWQPLFRALKLLQTLMNNWTRWLSSLLKINFCENAQQHICHSSQCDGNKRGRSEPFAMAGSIALFSSEELFFSP